MLNKVKFIAIATLSATSMSANSWPDGNQSNCLYAVTVSGTPSRQTPCPAADPIDLANNENIKIAISLLNINMSELSFRGCEIGRFFAMPDDRSDKKYIISYKIDKEKFLAPTLHELSHVLQMKNAGGSLALSKKYRSKRIELAADYMTGVMFSRLFKNMDLKKFEQNILLTGLYFESSELAHGRPDERISAFRLGVFEKKEEINMSEIELDFQRNIYAKFF
ncbi:hypothetical protein [Janthinobacterium sp. UMAB-60]|uniref:hypothetical protein n=1 Tax=Janthinobacterium sp. UMAB-60 TaxID=1365365 RepID=UPI001C56443E|nr:hypothetical protein [Janthinobacterium sp. UMAB-60]